MSSLIPSFNSKTVLFRFAHDRVQQAAASLIPTAERQQVHLKIGRLLLSHTADDDLDNAVIDLVQHFNTGGAHSLLTDQHEIRSIIGLELRAGRKAKASTAYSSAVEYLTVAKQLLNRLRPLPSQVVQHSGRGAAAIDCLAVRVRAVSGSARQPLSLPAALIGH